MAEQEKADQDEEGSDANTEIKKTIIEQLMKIRELSDNFIALIEKQEWTPDDIDTAFDLHDGMQEETEGIIVQLFDLKDAHGLKA